MINSNYKLKTRQTKEEGPTRRIRTQINQNSKKISFYLSRVPLNENKKVLNQSQNQPNKKSKTIKSILSKNPSGNSKLVTQPHDKNQIQTGQKQIIEKLFAGKKQQQGLTSTAGLKKDLNISYIGQNRYIFQDKVGSGTFGTVHRARDKKTLEIVAIKKVYQDRKYKNRELEILKQLNHPNVLEMKDSFFTYQGDKEYLNVVMDHYQGNLYDLIIKYRKKIEMPRLMVKVISYQIFRSLLYLSHIGISHRDIKPQNILVNQTNWKLVMCDFGSAKKLQIGEPNIAYICSRCYRAPQLIFGNTNYSTQIDMWSVGCVLAEIVMMQPIFRADSNIDQLVEIIRVLGTPSQAQIMEMNPDCDFNQYHLPKIGPRSWSKVLKKNCLGQQFIDLLNKVLTYSPKKRLTPLQALSHPFFDEIRQKQTYLKIKQQYNIPQLFDFNRTKQWKQSQLEKIIPKWYK